MEKWNGRVALVTGASAGIGAAICRSLVQAGMKVIGAARRVDKIKALAAELESEKGKLTAVSCDMTNDQDIYSLFKHIKEIYGGVDVCVNNAGVSHNSTLLEGTPKEWRQMTEVNVISLCLCTKLSVNSMKERGVDDGHIINISSNSGHRVAPNPSTRFYAGTKHAVRAVTEGLRQELREMKSHIRVSSISPGLVETEFSYVMTQDAEKAKNLYSSIHCLQAEDIASTLVHIMSAPPHVEINDVIIRPTEQVS